MALTNQKEKDRSVEFLRKAGKISRNKLAASSLGKSPKGTVRRSLFELGKSQGWWK